MARLNGRARIGWALLSAAALSVMLGFGGAVARADQGWWGDLDKGQSVRLSDVIASPERFRGRTLTFTCVFHRPEREFNPLRTRFNAERYDNVSVWPDASEVWAQKDFESDFPFLYVARNHPQRDALLRVDAFTRLEVTGRIEAVLTNTPFIEVTAWKLTGHRLGKDVVETMMRGETYARSGDPDARGIAIDNYRRALGLLPDLAPIYAEKIRARLAKALDEAGRGDEAADVRAGAVAPAAPYDPSQAAPPAMLPGEEVPTPGTLPGSPSPGVTDPGSPDSGALPGSTLPGTPADEPPVRRPAVPVPAGFPPPSAPVALQPQPVPSALPSAAPSTLPSAQPSEGPPAGVSAPALPGSPWDHPPAARAPIFAPPLVPARALPRAAPGATPLPPAGAPASPLAPSGADAPVAAPLVVDPPLPPPIPGGSPPPRRPRLAGVK